MNPKDRLTQATPKEQLQEILLGTAQVLATPEELLKKLETSYENKIPLNIKFGADPSRPDIHLGHTVVLQKLKTFQDFGHNIQFIIGDFTARIGDPTGRNKTRPELTPETVQQNSQTYRDQVMGILDPASTQVFYNGDWLDHLKPMDFVRLMATRTVQQLMVREDFQNRYRDENPIYFHELLYPILQGFDSVTLRSHVELGGTDQTFNLLMGRELQKHHGRPPQTVITMPLLEGLDGVQKMSKSYDNYIGVSEPPKDIYGKTMSLSDTHMMRFYELLSVKKSSEIAQMKEDLQKGIAHPMVLKKTLARELVARFWGASAAQKAEAEFESLFSKGETPEVMPVRDLPYQPTLDLLSFFVAEGFAPSRSEVRRMVAQNGIKKDGEPVKNEILPLEKGKSYIFRYGKLKWVQVKVI
jgi:tyrosyl-tRNA synthetase